MRFIICFLFILIDQLNVQAQKPVDKLRTDVSFVFLNHQPKDSIDMNLLIIYKNKSKKTDSVYWYFKDGYMGDEDFNLHIAMEKLKDNKYVYFPMFHYQGRYFDKKPSTVCLDLPKKLMSPLSADTVIYNLLHSGKFFEVGKYRFKAFVRTRCSLEHGRGTDYNPFFPEIDYVNSEWIYFEVKKEVFARIQPL